MSSSFRIEKLEDRILLAGNITAVQNGSQLVINGDADDNVIGVFGMGAGSVKVVEIFGGTVNGGMAGQDFTGITNIVVRGRAGDDNVHVQDLDISSNLTIQLNNDVGGHQSALVTVSDIGGNLAISSDGNADVDVEVIASEIGGAAQIVTRGGYDGIGVEDTYIDGQLVINAGHGDNDVYLGGLEGGLEVGGKLVVLDGADNLTLDAYGIYVGGTLNVDAGARGDSDICLEDMYVGGQGWIRTGDGEDFVGICDVEVELGVVVALREGDDVLAVGYSDFHSHVQASGGPDYDELIDQGGNTFAIEPIVSNFEFFGFGEGCGCIIAQEPL